MGSVSFGPALAGFPAFPLLPLDALADPTSLPPEVLAQIQQTFQALNFQFTDTTFSFELNSAIFGRPGDFDYGFTFTGNFASLAANPQAVFAAFSPAFANFFPIQWQTARTVNLLSGELAIAAEAEALGPPISFLQFFSTLLDPRNFTQNLLTTFTGGALVQFSTLDLSAFANGVISGRPNGSTITRDGTISRPDGAFVDSAFGIVSFDGEVRALTFTNVLGGAGGDVLAATDIATRIDGGGGDDLILGGLGADALIGGAGRDVIAGGGGDDHMTGGAGGDVFVIARAPGTVTTVVDFDARSGDRLDVSDLVGKGRLTFGKQADGDLTLTIHGRDGAQTIVLEGVRSERDLRHALIKDDDDGARAGLDVGGAGDDRLRGGRNDDILAGGRGDDVVSGGRGADVLLGEAGDDRLRGDAGDDVLDGGTGADVLIGGAGFDVLTGGFGADRFVYTGIEAAYDRIADFEVGIDRIDISALVGGAAVTAANFADYVQVTPLGPTELTGFLAIDRDGAGDAYGFEIIAQLDGEPFAIVGGLARSVLTAADFIV